MYFIDTSFVPLKEAIIYLCPIGILSVFQAKFPVRSLTLIVGTLSPISTLSPIWQNEINSSEKLDFYRICKQGFHTINYVNTLRYSQERQSFAHFVPVTMTYL